MQIISLVIKSENGVHVRPATQLVSLVKSLGCDIYLSSGGKRVSADSILSVLSLGLKYGSVVNVEAPTPSTAQIVADFISNIGK